MYVRVCVCVCVCVCVMECGRGVSRWMTYTRVSNPEPTEHEGQEMVVVYGPHAVRSGRFQPVAYLQFADQRQVLGHHQSAHRLERGAVCGEQRVKQVNTSPC